MNGPQQYHSFTASDIERYHKGQMPPAERHALEKAALDDPFLADAIEGFTYSATPTEDLAKLQERLEEKTGSKKVVPFFQQLYAWVRIASLFFILAGAGWFLYRSGALNNNKIAVTQK